MKQNVKRLFGILLGLALALGLLTGTALADYTVEFTRGELQYVMPGDSDVPLSEILETVGLTGKVEAVEVSDESLFSASNEGGEWVIHAHQAFNTSEWMKAVIDGVEYEIAVTDDPGSAYAGTDVRDLTPTSQDWFFCGSNIYYESYYYLTSGAYYIDENVTIDRPLMVAQGNTVTLNLNGNTLTGNSGDSVIVVAGGTLTVNDGTITGGQGNEEIRYGGYSRGGGLAVDFYSNVTLNDVVITGNSAVFGGGIFIHGPGEYSGDPAFVTLNRCTVTGNSGDGAGVFFDGGNLTVNDSVISGNTGWGLKVGAQCDGVFLKGDSVIYGNTIGDVYIGGDVGAYGSLQGVSVVGELGPNAKIGINMERPNVFTNSENTAYNDPSKFVSNSDSWIPVKNTDGQLMLVEASKVKVKTTDYTGPYDGNEHTITYELVNGDEATSLKFGTEEGTYNLTEPPRFTAYGVHPVYYQINVETVGGTYVPIVGGATVNIQAVVSFAHGAGSGEMASVNVDAGSLYTLPESSFTEPENVVGEFGWRSSADSKLYAPGAKVKVSGNTTFTAEWVTGKVARFVAGGGSGDAPAETVKLPGAVIKLPRNTFTAPSGDKRFIGWSDGTTLYYPGDQYTLNNDVTFTAQWDTEKKASFAPGGGNGTGPEQITAAPGEQITLPANTFTPPSKKVFSGWSDGSATYGAGDAYVLAKDTTFTAQWTPGTTISYELTDDCSDSWNGAAIKVTDKETGNVIATLTVESGYGASGTLDIPAGRTVVFTWVSGEYDDECSYTVKDAEENVIFSGSNAMSEPKEYRYGTAILTYTVTFKVVNGSWNEGEGEAATADKTVTLTGYEGDTLKLTADQIPAVGSKPNDTYKAGSWDVTPDTDTAITQATTYTYTYAKKDAAVVTEIPTAKTLTYNGQAQELVTAGEASDGTMYYALGTDATTAPADNLYTTSIPTGTDVGTYYVWYKVAGDSDHNDTEPVCVTVKVKLGEPRIAGYDLLLDGTLGLRCYVEVPEDFEGTGAEMTFSMNHREAQVIPYSSAETDTATGYKVFTCHVYSYQMADAISVSFAYQKDGTKKTVTDTNSVKDYLEDLSVSGYSEAVQNLVKATRAFGHFFQPYSARIHNWEYGVKYNTMPYDGTVDVVAATNGSADHKYTLTTMDAAHVQSARYRLLLNADTTLIVEVKLNDTPTDTVTMTLDGNAVTPTVIGTTCCVEIGNIAANNLAVSHRVVMQIDGTTVFDFTASPISFVHTVLNKSNPAEDEQNALASLYEYWQAAYAYAQSN